MFDMVSLSSQIKLDHAQWVLGFNSNFATSIRDLSYGSAPPSHVQLSVGETNTKFKSKIWDALAHHMLSSLLNDIWFSCFHIHKIRKKTFHSRRCNTVHLHKIALMFKKMKSRRKELLWQTLPKKDGMGNLSKQKVQV